jgi:transposase
MQDMPGESCACGEDPSTLAPYCSDCGTRKEWIDRSPHSQVYECPVCS